MAFGVKATEKQASTGSAGSAKKQLFFSPFMNIKQGSRQFRILPNVDANGVASEEAAEPTIGIDFWLDVMRNGKTSKARAFVDNRYDNPMRNRLLAEIDPNLSKAERDAEARTFPIGRVRFFLNVWDITPVIRLTEEMVENLGIVTYDGIVYPNLDNQYIVFGANKKPIKLDAKLKGPRNEIVILEGSAGRMDDPKAKHTLRKFAALEKEVSTDDGDGFLPLTAFGVRLKITGESTGTEYVLTSTSDRDPLSSEVYMLPRYDLDSFVAPWPNEALEALIDGEDFNEVIKAYNIATFPKLNTSEEGTFTD